MSNDVFALRAQTVLEAYVDWIKSEFKVGSAQRQEFGRFAFNVTAGTIGVIFTVAKFAERTQLGAFGGLGLSLLFIGTVVALVMAIPPLRDVDDETNIAELHRSTVKSFRRLAWYWFVIWLAGAVAGAVDLVST